MDSAEELLVHLIGQAGFDELMKADAMLDALAIKLAAINEKLSDIGAGAGGSTVKDYAVAQQMVNTAYKEGVPLADSYNRLSKQAIDLISQQNGHSREAATVIFRLAQAESAAGKAAVEAAKVQTEASRQRLNDARIETETLKQRVLQIKLTKDEEVKAFESTKAIRAQEAQLQKKRQADETELARLIQTEAKERAAADEKELAMMVEKEAAGKRYIAMYTQLLAAEEAAAARGGTTIQKRNTSLFPQAPLTGSSGATPAPSVQDRYAAVGVTNEERAAIQARAAALDMSTGATKRASAAERELIAYTAEEVAALQAQGIVLKEGSYILKESAGATTANATAQKLFGDAQSVTRKETESASGGIVNATKGMRGFWGVLRQVAYILPGIGMAGIFNLAFEAIAKVWEQLTKTNEQVRLFTIMEKEAAEYGNRVAEAYGKEAASLELVKGKIENVNVPMHARLQGVKDIQKQFPDYFGNLTKEKILIGDVGDAYLKASAAILANARLRVYGEDLGKADTELIRAEDRINRISDLDKWKSGLTKNAKGYFEADKMRIGDGGEMRNNPLIATGELDKDGKPIWTTLLDEIKKYNSALADHFTVLNKIKEVQPLAEADVKKKETKGKTPKDFSIQTGNALAAGDAEQFEAQKNLRLADAALQKQIADDEKRTLDERLEAYRKYYNDLNAAALLDYAKDRDIVERKLEANTEALSKTTDAGKREKLEADRRTLNNRLLTIDTEFTVKKNKLDADRTEFTQKAEDKASEQNLAAAVEGMKRIQEQYEASYGAEKEALDEKHTAGLISEKSYHEGRLQLSRKYGKLIIEAQIENFQELLSSGALGKEGDESFTKTLDLIQKLRDKLNAAPSNKPTKGVLGWTDEDIKLFDEVRGEIDLYAQSLNNINKLFDEASQKRINGWNDEIDAIEKAKESDINLVTLSIGNADKKAKAIAVINQRAAQEEANIQRKIKEEQHKQAVRDKDVALAEIVIKTALAVVSQLGAGDPYSAIPRAIAVGILGAAEFAVAAAQPIPAYRLGTKDHIGGPAIVGDGGVAEVAELPGGELRVTPAVPTLVDYPAHTMVHKSIEDFITDMQRRTLTVRGIGMMRHVDERQESRSLEAALDRHTAAVVSAIKAAPQPGFSITGAGIRTFVSNGSNQTEYLQNI